MVQKSNRHTAEFIKRKAKSIKKEEGISYQSALDKAAQSVGFSGWSNFINQSRLLLPPKVKANTSELKNSALTILPITQSDSDINPYRKLLVLAINELLGRNLISLSIDLSQRSTTDEGYIFLDLLGYPSVVLWDDVGYHELRVSVWWNYNHKLHPQINLTGNAKEVFNHSSPLASRQQYRKFVGIVASGWLERKDGKFLQGEGSRGIFDVYTRRGEIARFEEMPTPKPKGYLAEGKVYF